VDVPEFRSKFLELYYGRYLRPVKDYLIGSLEFMLPLAARVPGLYNALVGSRAGRALMRRVGLVESPLLTGIDLAAELRRRGYALATPEHVQGLAEAEREKAVIVVQDAFTSFFETPLLLDLFELLRELGFTPLLAPFRANGKPLHVHGFLGAFLKVAAANAESLHALNASGIPLVGVDPSMTLTYRAEYAKTLGKDAVPNVQLLQEWLVSRLDALPQRAARPGSGYTLLPHCTEKTNAPAAGGDWQKVFAALGVKLESQSAGCCGMAGTYGHEADKRAMSETIYGLSWAKLVEADRGQDRLLATG
jgi:Fe-S oxidoreductase